MADDFDAKSRAIARAVADELENRGWGITLPEAKQLAQIDAGESYFCSNCGYQFPSEDLVKSKCPKCGNTRAQPNPVFRCARCNRPVDRGMVSCPSCGTKEAVRAERSLEV